MSGLQSRNTFLNDAPPPPALAFLVVPFSRPVVPVRRARAGRKVYRHGHDEREGDRRDYPTKQDQQGHYFG